MITNAGFTHAIPSSCLTSGEAARVYLSGDKVCVRPRLRSVLSRAFRGEFVAGHNLAFRHGNCCFPEP
jgi:hypothetical protein